MSDSSLAPRRESPLVEIEFDAAAGPVHLREQAFVSQVNLRGDPEDAAFLAACREVLGLALPLQPNTFVAEGARRLCWLGPDEWLVTDEGGDGAALADRLETALQGVRHAVNEVGSGYTTIRLQGELSAALIARGCSLDLHAGAFVAGQCAQTHIAKAVVLLLKITEDEPRFDIVVRRSFADYLWRWLDYVNREILANA